MLRGLTNVSFYADDLVAAERWYTELLGIAPYYAGGAPRYIEFRVGDYQHELGIDRQPLCTRRRREAPGGAIIYWHVDDVAAHPTNAAVAGRRPSTAR